MPRCRTAVRYGRRFPGQGARSPRRSLRSRGDPAGPDGSSGRDSFDPGLRRDRHGPKAASEPACCVLAIAVAIRPAIVPAGTEPPGRTDPGGPRWRYSSFRDLLLAMFHLSANGPAQSVVMSAKARTREWRREPPAWSTGVNAACTLPFLRRDRAARSEE